MIIKNWDSDVEEIFMLRYNDYAKRRIITWIGVRGDGLEFEIGLVFLV
jgi:hypothetical protein